MQTLTEEFFLLSFNSYKHTFSDWHHRPKFEYGLCGAFLFEQILSEKMMFSDKKELVVNTEVQTTTTWAEELLEKVEKKKGFEALFGKKYGRTLLNWLKVLKMEINELKTQTNKMLKSKNIIGEKPIKLLGVKVYTTNILQDGATLKALKDKLERAILSQTYPDLQTFMLLRLLKAAKTVDQVFVEKNVEEKKHLTNNLNQLFEKDDFAQTLDSLLRGLRREELEEMTDMMETLSEVISDIADAVDGAGDGGSDGSGDGGDGGGGDGGGD